MTATLPLAPVMIAIETLSMDPELSVVGIDLDSGKRVTVRVAAPEDMSWIAQKVVPTVGLVLVLTLVSMDALTPLPA